MGAVAPGCDAAGLATDAISSARIVRASLGRRAGSTLRERSISDTRAGGAAGRIALSERGPCVYIKRTSSPKLSAT